MFSGRCSDLKVILTNIFIFLTSLFMLMMSSFFLDFIDQDSVVILFNTKVGLVVLSIGVLIFQIVEISFFTFDYNDQKLYFMLKRLSYILNLIKLLSYVGMLILFGCYILILHKTLYGI